MTGAVHPFSSRHIGPSLEDQRAMLAVIGVPSIETLISQAVPQSIRLDAPLDLPAPASEAEANVAYLKQMLGRAGNERVGSEAAPGSAAHRS